jgi:hypothetical protein
VQFAVDKLAKFLLKNNPVFFLTWNNNPVSLDTHDINPDVLYSQCLLDHVKDECLEKIDVARLMVSFVGRDSSD